MLKGSSTRRFIALQIVTLGFYFLRWCSVARRDINTAAGREMIPSLWWFLVPGGIYWWMWHYSEAMAVVTHQRLKASDTFLIYVLSSSAWLVGGSGIGNVFNFQSSTGDPNFHLILIAIVVVVGVLLLLGLAGNTFFMCYMQRKTDGIRKPTSN